MSVGFYSPTNKANPAANANVGFWERGGRVHKVAFPASKAPDGKSSPPVDQLLGISNAGEAVGFYLDASGNAHGYLYGIGTRRFVPQGIQTKVHEFAFPGADLTQAGVLVGFFTGQNGDTHGMLARP